MSVAKSIQGLWPFWRERQVKNILDYGAGNMRNSLFLREKGFNVIVVEQSGYWRHQAKSYGFVHVYDPQKASTFGEVDLVLLNFVLNVISNIDDRSKVLEQVSQSLKLGGYLLVEVSQKLNSEIFHEILHSSSSEHCCDWNWQIVTDVSTHFSTAVLFQKMEYHSEQGILLSPANNNVWR